MIVSTCMVHKLGMAPNVGINWGYGLMCEYCMMRIDSVGIIWVLCMYGLMWCFGWPRQPFPNGEQDLGSGP